MEHDRVQPCPEEETLLAYALELTDEFSTRAVEEHLETCDACLSALALARQRLRQLGDAGGIAVPPLIAAQVAASPHRVAAAPVGGALARRVRLPISPRAAWAVALAASVVLVVGLQLGGRGGERVPERTTRAVAASDRIQVSAAAAEVRREPHPRAAVVATLRRGDTVTVGSEEREWYRVRLPDGTEGWVEQDAFR